MLWPSERCLAPFLQFSRQPLSEQTFLRALVGCPAITQWPTWFDHGELGMQRTSAFAWQGRLPCWDIARGDIATAHTFAAVACRQCVAEGFVRKWTHFGTMEHPG